MKRMGRKFSGRMKPTLALLIFTLAVVLLNSLHQQYAQGDGQQLPPLNPPELHSKEGVAATDMLFLDAFRKQQSNLQLSGVGRVLRVLPDDNKGSRHQRFLVQLEIGHTLLIAHNIDLAPRVDNLREGEEIEFYGEYEWNAKGGVIHWTHHDPKGKHPDGWIKYQGRVYR